MQKRGHQPREREACLPARVTNVSVDYLLQPPHPVWIASVWAHVCICLQTHGYVPLWHDIRKVIGTPGLKIKQINTIIHTQWVKSIWCLNIHRCYSVSAERQRSSGKTEPKGHRCMAPLKPWTMTGRLNEVSLSHWTLRDFPVTRGNQAASNNLPAKVSILDTRPLMRAKQHISRLNVCNVLIWKPQICWHFICWCCIFTFLQVKFCILSRDNSVLMI